MKKKKPYSERVKLIKKKCDDLWAKTIKARANGICEICGQEGHDAHHLESRSLNVRWDLDTGCFLCRGCHCFGKEAAHATSHSGQVAFHKKLIEKYGSEYLEDIAQKANQLRKWNLSELEELKENLQAKLNE